MTGIKKKKKGNGLFSTLVVLLLLALTVGLYLQIVIGERQTQQQAPVQQASVRVVEGREPAVATTGAVLKDLPADQMNLIIDVFAPERSR